MIDSASNPEDPNVVRAIEGDHDALEELLRELGPPLMGELAIEPRWRKLLDPEDVMQVSYLEAYLRIGTLREKSRDGFRGWRYGG